MTGINEEYMREAVMLAKQATASGDVPVGAVVVRHGEIIGRGFNTRENGGGTTGHAEINAINEACRVTGGWRLPGCEIYVTLEPCPMCAGAILASRIDRIVIGAPDVRGGAFGGLFDIRAQPLGSNPPVIFADGDIAEECAALMREFFAQRREENEKRRQSSRRLGREFYERHADTVAPELLGKVICRMNRESGEITRSRITETECYLGENDTACHAHRGMTDRNRVMWDKGGTVYIYLCYGIHNLMNIVTGVRGEPEAVLIRGVEDAAGPGRVTKKLSVDRKFNGSDVVFSDELWIEDDGYYVDGYSAAPRIGIDYAQPEDRERPWRYTLN